MLQNSTPASTNSTATNPTTNNPTANDAPASAPDANDFSQQTFDWDDRHWRVRGLDTQLSRTRLRVNLMVERMDLVHVDTLDLYVARLRSAFIRQAAEEVLVDPQLIKRDLGRILLALERLQDQMLDAPRPDPARDVPPMTDAQRDAALDLLRDPKLAERIVQDHAACGLVGQPVGKLVCYLACVSRLLPQPLAVLIQSSSAAGKTALLDATLRLMPAEQQVRMSALTAQALYYMGPDALRHKILAIAEEEGVSQAAYALKLLQSEGRLTIVTTEKNRLTGRQQTRRYQADGPVAMLLTTTAEQPDAELANRCITLGVDEQPEQTAAIHRQQRRVYLANATNGQQAAIQRRHQDAQRLLEPLPVVIPWAERLTFRTDQTRYRRDHAKYLALIAASALLHQYQRQRTRHVVDGQPVTCVLATLDDLALANQLARQVLAPRREPLLPATRRLLGRIGQYVQQQAARQAIAPTVVRFTQRQLREALAAPDRSLRRGLARLVQLEYVAVESAGRGNGRRYRLCDGCVEGIDQGLSLGLVDADQLRHEQVAKRRKISCPSDAGSG